MGTGPGVCPGPAGPQGSERVEHPTGHGTEAADADVRLGLAARDPRKGSLVRAHSSRHLGAVDGGGTCHRQGSPGYPPRKDKGRVWAAGGSVNSKRAAPPKRNAAARECRLASAVMDRGHSFAACQAGCFFNEPLVVHDAAGASRTAGANLPRVGDCTGDRRLANRGILGEHLPHAAGHRVHGKHATGIDSYASAARYSTLTPCIRRAAGVLQGLGNRLAHGERRCPPPSYRHHGCLWDSTNARPPTPVAWPVFFTEPLPCF